METRQSIDFGVQCETKALGCRLKPDSGNFEARRRALGAQKTVPSSCNDFRPRLVPSAARIFATRESGGPFLYGVIILFVRQRAAASSIGA
jgi:hypothetical protein